MEKQDCIRDLLDLGSHPTFFPEDLINISSDHRLLEPYNQPWNSSMNQSFQLTEEAMNILEWVTYRKNFVEFGFSNGDLIQVKSYLV